MGIPIKKNPDYNLGQNKIPPSPRPPINNISMNRATTKTGHFFHHIEIGVRVVIIFHLICPGLPV